VSERVEYDAYGFARHFWPTDIDRNGYTESADADIVKIADGLDALIGDSNYDSNLDINRDGAITDADVSLASAAVGKGPLAPGMISDPDGMDNPIGYDGYVFDVESGLYSVRFRWYDTTLGRWVERDPLGHMAGSNLYQYCSDTPQVRIDGSGLFDIAGHYWGSFILMRCMGKSVDEALKIAYFAYLPDRIDEFTAYNAGQKLIRKKYTDENDKQYYLDVQEILHSLHGGDGAAAERRRQCLQKALKASGLTSWQYGFILHALGDAYAHTKDDESAYSSPWGHAADGDKPDIIGTNPGGKFNRFCIMTCQSVTGHGFPIDDEICRGLLGVPAGETEEETRSRFRKLAIAKGWKDQKFDPAKKYKKGEPYDDMVPTRAELGAWLKQLRKELECCESELKDKGSPGGKK
jgi:RHS repeat-associated protein